MKRLFLIANWKAHNPQPENWFMQIASLKEQMLQEKEMIVCPPSLLLSVVKEEIQQKGLPIKIGGQDVSLFPSGAYTGEMPAELLKEFATYCIIGHSERRQHFSESDEVVAKKASMAKQYGIEPVLCVQDENTPVPDDVAIVAYEPVAAIGSGHPDTPENADTVAKAIKEKNNNVQYVVYGGSVDESNVGSFTKMEHISGVLVGSASLDAHSFSNIYLNA